MAKTTGLLGHSPLYIVWLSTRAAPGAAAALLRASAAAAPRHPDGLPRPQQSEEGNVRIGSAATST